MEVLKIQQKLNDLGYTIYPMANNYGPKTTAAVKQFQKDNNLPQTGIADSKTLSLLFPLDAPFLYISKNTINKLIEFEISSKAYYEKFIAKPHWPGGASGVTLGIGYDLGYHTKDEIRKDWENYLSPSELSIVIKCAGMIGSKAKAETASIVNKIKIPYDVAYKVFVEVSYPKYLRQALSIYPNLKNLHANAKGAIVNLVFNRGNSLVGDSRKEMKALQDCIKKTDYNCTASQIISMKRLWFNKNLDGLLTRRDWEAKMVKSTIEENNTNCIKIYY